MKSMFTQNVDIDSSFDAAQSQLCLFKICPEQFLHMHQNVQLLLFFFFSLFIAMCTVQCAICQPVSVVLNLFLIANAYHACYLQYLQAQQQSKINKTTETGGGECSQPKYCWSVRNSKWYFYCIRVEKLHSTEPNMTAHITGWWESCNNINTTSCTFVTPAYYFTQDTADQSMLKLSTLVLYLTLFNFKTQSHQWWSYYEHCHTHSHESHLVTTLNRLIKTTKKFKLSSLLNHFC